jgi:hypothetical protein
MNCLVSWAFADYPMFSRGKKLFQNWRARSLSRFAHKTSKNRLKRRFFTLQTAKRKLPEAARARFGTGSWYSGFPKALVSIGKK